TRPTVGGTKPAIALSTVVLPHPDGPSSATNSPGVVINVNRRTASTRRSSEPKAMPRSVIAMRPVGPPLTATAACSFLLPAGPPRHAARASPPAQRARQHAAPPDAEH